MVVAFGQVFVAASGDRALPVGVVVARNEDVVNVQLHAGEVPATRNRMFRFAKS